MVIGCTSDSLSSFTDNAQTSYTVDVGDSTNGQYPFSNPTVSGRSWCVIEKNEIYKTDSTAYASGTERLEGMSGQPFSSFDPIREAIT